MLEKLKALSILEVSSFFLIANVFIFASSIFFCWLLGRLFANKRIFDHWEPLRPVEILAAVSCVILNSAVSVVGWKLWTHQLITLHNSGFLSSIADTFVMILAMDFGMYLFHRLAHIPVIYQFIHRFHHRHESTNPISLFVLHPFEVIGFGGLMIAFLILYPMSLAGLIAYLSLNVLFGTLGHSGVEPFPKLIRRIPLLNLIGTSTFHAEHHEHLQYNFGFYTLVWDKLFGTLDPEYASRFDQK